MSHPPLTKDAIRAIVRESIAQIIGETVLNLNEIKDREACKRAAQVLIATGCMSAGTATDVFGTNTHHAIAELIEGLETLNARLRATWEMPSKAPDVRPTR